MCQGGIAEGLLVMSFPSGHRGQKIGEREPMRFITPAKGKRWRACLNLFQKMLFVSDYWTQLMGSLRYSRIACGWVKVKVNPRNSQVERDCRITFLALAHKCMAPTWIMNLHYCDPGLMQWLGRFVLGNVGSPKTSSRPNPNAPTSRWIIVETGRCQKGHRRYIGFFCWHVGIKMDTSFECTWIKEPIETHK